MPGGSVSLRSRIGVATALLVLVGLGGIGVLLQRSLARGLEQAQLARLEAVALGLLAALDFDGDEVELLRPVAEPAFERVRSGWYWQVDEGAERVLSSRSLWLDRIEPPEADGVVHRHWPGPDGQPLFVFVHRGHAPGARERVTILVSAPEHELAAQQSALLRPLWGMLGLLSLLLGLGAALLSAWVLRPLGQCRQALERVRRGERARVEGVVASELKPLVDEIHGLLEYSQRSLERSRQHLADLAHALKTPLAVLRSELEQSSPGPSAASASALEQLERLVQGHLKRARAAGAHRVLGQRTALRPVIEGFAAWVAHLRQRHPVRWEVEILGEPCFAGEHSDLEELLGNLIENAAKWARRRLRVSALQNGDRLRICVEDDGPGMDPEALEAVLERGVRLDEAVEGSGLGLAIVQDLVRLYGGRLRLANREAGGLRAELDLPAA